MPLSPIPRRTFLRASGVSIGLPLLDAMAPRSLRAQSVAEATAPKRMLLVARSLGLYAPYFFPEQAGRDYTASRYLKILVPLRHDFTVFSGMSHHYRGGHGTLRGLLTGVAPERLCQGFLRNSISLDQEVAERLHAPTRYANLVLGRRGLSWNRQGSRIPSQYRAKQMFQQLFVTGTTEEVTDELQRLDAGHSILDGVRAQARLLSRQLGADDRQRIELLLTSVREAEQRLAREKAWTNSPKPQVDEDPFQNDNRNMTLFDRERQWFDLVHLAFQTDCTRVISLHLASHAAVMVNGQRIGHHAASHHGKNEGAIEQLAMIEEAQLQVLAEFLAKMKATQEGNSNLLDRTQILYASDLGNASAHTTRNLPILLAGGGFRHAGHVAFDRRNNLPLSNLFVRMLQQMDIEMDHFGSSTGAVADV